MSTLWARFKWSLFTSDYLNHIKAKIEEEGAERAVMYCSFSTSFDRETIKATNFRCLAPRVKDHKSKITTWIALCVPSMVWFLIHDPITRFADWAYTNIEDWFQEASDAKFKKAFAEEAPQPPTIESLETGTFEERR